MSYELSKKKINGLVLSGGGALGAYEVGAIQAFNEKGIHFEVVTGTSIGALNGAFYVGGQSQNLKKLWSNITPTKVMVDGFNLNSKLLTNPISDSFKSIKDWGKQYLNLKEGVGADITPFKQYIRNSLDVEACKNSDIKFGITTAKLPSYIPVDLCMNEIKDNDTYLAFLHASSACFPIFPVETINEKKYVDGFYNDNVPMRLAFDYGADELYVVDMKLFNKKPQHMFYLSLPNVHYIAPYISLGSMMDFSQETIQKNMKLGYLDTKKYFGDYRGFYFAFKDVKPVDGFMSYILHNFGINAEYILKELSKDITKKMDELDYFVRSVEIIAMRLGIDNYYEVYSLDDFVEILRKQIEKLKEAEMLKSVFSKLIDNVNVAATIAPSKIKSDYLIRFSVDFLNLVDENNKPLINPIYLNSTNIKRRKD